MAHTRDTVRRVSPFLSQSRPRQRSVGSLVVHCALLLLMLACDAPPDVRSPRQPVLPPQPVDLTPKRQPPKSRQVIQPATLETPTVADARLPDATFEAQLHRRAGRLGMARAAFETGWHTHQSPDVALIIGVLYQRARDHRSALRWLARADVPELADFIAFRVLRSAGALGEVAQALHAAERIPSQSRFAPHAKTQGAQILMKAGRPLDAAQWLMTRAGAPDEHGLDSLIELARAWQAAGRATLAIRAWRRVALRAGPSKVATRATRTQRRLQWRLPHSERRALAPDPDAHVLAGLADMDAHAYAAAEDRMLAALRDGIEDPAIGCQTWWLLARARSKQRRHGDAAPAYARYAADCAQTSRAPRAQYAEARAWFSADHPVAALRAARAVWRRWPTHRLADDARMLAARIHLNDGEEPEALDRVRASLWHTPHGDRASDAAWLVRQMGANPPSVTSRDRAHVGRLAYFEGVDLLAARQTEAAVSALNRARRQSPSGYYGLLASVRLRLLGRPAPRVTNPPIAITHARTGWAQGKALLSLGFVQDAWWAFDDAGPGPLEPGRYVADVARLFDQYGHDTMALRMFDRDVAHLDGLSLNADTAPWFDAVYPIEHIEIFEKWADARDLPVELVLALAHTESRFDPNARSWAGACGIMQIVPKTAADVARKDGVRGRMTCRRLRNVDLSVRLATRYLADLRGRFGSHPGVLAAAYNAGPGNALAWIKSPRAPFDQWVEGLPFHQARRYIKRVLAAMAVYTVRRTGTLPDIPFDW